MTFTANKTIAHPQDVHAPSATGPAYSRLQFLEPGVRSRRKAQPQSPQQHSPRSRLDHLEPPAIAIPTTGRLTSREIQTLPNDSFADVNSSRNVPHHEIGISATIPEMDDDLAYPYIVSPNTNDYETALEVLVSLGGSGDTGPQEASNVAVLVQRRHDDTTQSSEHARTVPGLDTLRQGFDDMKILKLLTYYRYHVAPRLDICDPDQTFGLVVPRLAMQSNRICSSLMSLSMSLELGMDVLDMTIDAAPLRLANPLLDEFVAETLDKTRQFATSLPYDWQRLVPHDISCLMDALQKRNVWKQAGCLRLRLVLASALASGKSVNLDPSIQYSSPSINSTSSNDVCDSTLHLFILCARSTNLCINPASHQILGQSPAQAWQSLAQSLQVWYDTRCQSFQPILDIDLPTSTSNESTAELFPTIVFSTSAATLANSIYHTSMVLLLRHKPRTLPALPSASSLLWHARRVCGIALGNTNKAHWDPCLFSALFVAASVMTYVPQQAKVVQCLEDAGVQGGWRALAGWFIGELHKVWTPV